MKDWIITRNSAEKLNEMLGKLIYEEITRFWMKCTYHTEKDDTESSIKTGLEPRKL